MNFPLSQTEEGVKVSNVVSAQPDRIPTTIEERLYRPPAGMWVDGICDWYKNLFPTCYCSLFACHGVWLLAQLAKKTKFLHDCLPDNKIFIAVIAVYAFLLIIAIVLSVIHDIPHHSTWIPGLWCVIIGTGLRLHVVKQQRLNSNGNCGIAKECAIGIFCSPCSICQLGRHIYGYKNVLDGDAMIDKPDLYFDEDGIDNAPQAIAISDDNGIA